MHKFKTTASVWVSKYSEHDAISLQNVIDIRDITIAHAGANLAAGGYTHVGHADIIVTIAPPDRIIGCKVASLRAELEKDRADSQMRQIGLLDKINKMEALSYDEAPA